MSVNIDELDMDELIETEDELILMYRRLGLEPREYRRLVNLTKQRFAGYREVLRFRDLVKKELKKNG